MKINLVWTGPETHADALKRNNEKTDYGIYQIYGSHPVYGADTLLYIGQANAETFAQRISQQPLISQSTNDAFWDDNGLRIRFHTGRIHWRKGHKAPTNKYWGALIDRAERLLIYAHSPAWNAALVRNPPEGEVFHEFNVLNWGQYGRLLPEVSGARYVNQAMLIRVNDDPLG